MKLCQIIHALFLTCTLLGVTVTVRAADAGSGKMLVYISPQDYTNSTKLWHFFYDYWFKQGPVIEPIALEALGAEFGKVKMCQADSMGNMLVWIKPRMYYNPQMGVFYGEVTADVFTGGGRALGAYVGESRKLGFLDVYPNLQIEALYKIAMQNSLEKMKADQGLQAAITENMAAGETKSPCGLVAVMPPAKANDLNYFFKRINYD